MSHSSRPSSSAGSPLDSAAAPVHITQQTQQTQQRGGKVSEFIDLVKDKISAKRKKPIATQDPPKPKRDALKKFKNLRRKNSKAPPIDDREDKDNLHQAFREYSGLPEIDEDRKANEVLKILAPEPSSEPHTSLAPADEPPPSSHLYVRRPSKFSMAARPLPDPATLFDTLLKAGEEDWKPHDNGLSGMTYAIATIISLSLVRTNPENVSYNDASPYLDLAPLYGPNDEELDLIRLNDGSGKLSPDAFYEDTNNILFTPAAAVLLILLNRYHNSIAETLLSKNERGTWRDPSTFFDDAEEFVNYEVEKQDNEIFEIARSMTCIQFKNIVMEDVLKGLLGVSPVGGCVNLDILADADGIRKPGAGYQSSVESSLLYNWFGLMSSDDINYVSTTLRDRLPYKAIDEITIDDVKRAQASMLLDSDRTRRDVAGMRRNEDGYFNDADLARVLHSATEARAGASCSKRVASCLRAWQLELVQQSRNWEVCTLNEYRASLGLKPLKSFEEWSADDAVRRSAAHHYGEIKNLELYPGLQAESGIPGDGLQLGYTMVCDSFGPSIGCTLTDVRPQSFGLSSDLVSHSLVT
ncbi:heme peroxidase [Pluteus cervinus]|uniref:Heme peroxidase n=1 Tax=Pluteus cervinus TaxID=181527 RepID=A0ACD3AWR7_9AGAR|nr:heme peroxidase [Pluteus cervinus]